jgi:hypothetical protein
VLAFLPEQHYKKLDGVDASEYPDNTCDGLHTSWKNEDSPDKHNESGTIRINTFRRTDA